VNRNEAPAKIELPLMKKTGFFYSRARIASFEEEGGENGRRSYLLAVALGINNHITW
jgi:hypothetical protein